MFTGIIEQLVPVVSIKQDNANVHFTFKTALVEKLQVDQSIAHNGVCLTVTAIDLEKKEYQVTAIQETLDKTNLGQWKVGDFVNFERCMQLGARLDGHMVQGHVDTTALCTKVSEENGSWKFHFEYQSTDITVAKGSICINGVSLTVVDSETNSFSVAIIPFTYEHTTFKFIETGSRVNLEFDVIGKYVQRILDARNS